MASFAAEDQTDEDFFDKLVDDDFGCGQEESCGGEKFEEGDDSDDMKAFGFDVSAGFEANEKVNAGGGDVLVSSDVVQAEESVIGGAGSSPSSTSSVVEHVNARMENLSVEDIAVSNKVAYPGGSGVKEIQWNSLFTDSSATENEGFGLYSDLFGGDVGADDVYPFSVVKQNAAMEVKEIYGGDQHIGGGLTNDASNVTYGETQAYQTVAEKSVSAPDISSVGYWESQYPGWKYDLNTGQWYQVESFDASANSQDTNLVGNSEVQSSVSEVTIADSYYQQATQSVSGSVVESVTTVSASVSSWNQGSQANNGFPEHMIFDPQYPDWYYDSIAHEWRMLDSYVPSNQETSHVGEQQNQNGFPSSHLLSQESSNGVHHTYTQPLNNGSQTTVTHDQYGGWGGLTSNYEHQNHKGLESNGVLTNNNNIVDYGRHAPNRYNASQGFGTQEQNSTGAPSMDNCLKQDQNIWPATSTINGALSDSSRNQKQNSSRTYADNHVDQRKAFPNETAPSYNHINTACDDHMFQSFVPSENVKQQVHQAKMEPLQHLQFSSNHYNSQQPSYFPQQSLHAGNRFSYNPSTGRSSAGRPPHALVSFGFGGKLIVMKDSSSMNLSYGYQDSTVGTISVLNLMEVVTDNNHVSDGTSGCDYFPTLCQQSFPGPLVGGSVGNKELYKWIEERISNCEQSNLDYRQVETLRLLLSLLRIACQHYGKLRSPYGSGPSLKGNDSPESAVAKLFASVKGIGGRYGNVAHCLQQLPSEGQLRATASEVQNLLISGSKREALECALQGQLWGPALVIASQFGDHFYVDAIKQMALRQLVPGSPMRTLCLLIAGHPEAVFAADNNSAYSDAINMYQQSTQVGANSMLDDWQENLAIISTYRTKDDGLVIINLGDCLWRDRSEIISAHICYLVAEASFEPYSDSARLCLIGANHLKYPRTYASPAAIQRTELYEYSKLLGNSQFVLLPFQPYKFVYACMLAELGKVLDSHKYCQAILKSLKNGRAAEVEFWKQLVTSLEERLKTHQQGGFSTNLAPAKLVGKILNFLDSTTHRVIGGPPPPGPSAAHGSTQSHDHYQQPSGPRVWTSQSTMAMSSLVQSPSTEQVNEWSGQNNRATFHTRSASEPNFGRADQVDPSKETGSPNAQGKASVSGGSRFGRFGFSYQLLQETMGLVMKSKSDKQAELGETNKFYYDDKLKRWVEEGADPPAEEATLPPPPSTAAFQNGTADPSAIYRSEPYSNASPDQRTPQPSEHGAGISPIPPNSSHLLARARTGVRSRYVDTYNQGNASPTPQTFMSPPFPSVKHAPASSAKFFVPHHQAQEIRQ